MSCVTVVVYHCAIDLKQLTVAKQQLRMYHHLEVSMKDFVLGGTSWTG